MIINPTICVPERVSCKKIYENENTIRGISGTTELLVRCNQALVQKCRATNKKRAEFLIKINIESDDMKVTEILELPKSQYQYRMPHKSQILLQRMDL